jgi:hypothetical protein
VIAVTLEINSFLDTRPAKKMMAAIHSHLKVEAF